MEGKPMTGKPGKVYDLGGDDPKLLGLEDVLITIEALNERLEEMLKLSLKLSREILVELGEKKSRLEKERDEAHSKS